MRHQAHSIVPRAPRLQRGTACRSTTRVAHALARLGHVRVECGLGQGGEAARARRARGRRGCRRARTIRSRARTARPRGVVHQTHSAPRRRAGLGHRGCKRAWSGEEARPSERDEREDGDPSERGPEGLQGRAWRGSPARKQRKLRWNHQQRHGMQWRQRLAGGSAAGGALAGLWSALTGSAAGSAEAARPSWCVHTRDCQSDCAHAKRKGDGR